MSKVEKPESATEEATYTDRIGITSGSNERSDHTRMRFREVPRARSTKIKSEKDEAPAQALAGS
jgi:hypothetical protein